MAITATGNGFIPPYFFNHLSRIDEKNQEAWKNCYQQSLKSSSDQKLPTVSACLNSPSPFDSSTGGVTVIPDDPHDPGAQSAKKSGEIILKFLQEELNSFIGFELKVYMNVEGLDENAQWSNGAVYLGKSIDKERDTTLERIAQAVGRGIVDSTANFIYKGQSGALKESWSDVFSSMVKQYSKKQIPSAANWLIGDEYFKGLPQLHALRSLKEPGEAYKNDPQVGTMKKYGHVNLNIYLDNDHGGVHIYSGIPNKAFYRFASIYCPEHFSWEVAGKIWYEALQSCTPETTFEQFAQATLIAIDNVVLPRSIKGIIKTYLLRSWYEVEVEVQVTEHPTIPIRSIHSYEKLPMSTRQQEDDCCLIQ